MAVKGLNHPRSAVFRPQFFEEGPQILEVHFSDLAHFQTCSKVRLSAVRGTPRRSFKKQNKNPGKMYALAAIITELQASMSVPSSM